MDYFHESAHFSHATEVTSIARMPATNQTITQILLWVERHKTMRLSEEIHLTTEQTGSSLATMHHNN
ncbi:hypothetical protein OURE66S_01375 [Oligella ureolytica]